ncbi:MAG: homoserine dehydrogenase [Alphaproteobacteria bacterium]|nr:homoserine dehydrogenase [Alphaproteobacteria bacterium]
MPDALKVGVAGLGTVGAATVKLLAEHAPLLALRCDRPIRVVAVAARDRARGRGIDLKPYRWFDDPVALARDPGVDAVVEVIGGADGPARATCRAAIEAGKHLVTANKALLAKEGTAIARLAEAKGVRLGFEAAVAGGIPIIKALREGLAANRIARVFGILNGTCNYILTTMRTTGREFADVLADAQKLGYAEADPSFDIDGVDAAHKLSVLASLAFGTEIDFAAMHVEGIRHVSATDFAFADELGFRIKLLGIAERIGHAGGEGERPRIAQRVHPCLVAADSPIAAVDGVFNGVVVEGDYVGTQMFEGRGAGGGPTASAVVADLIDMARGVAVPAFAIPAAKLVKAEPVAIDRRVGAYYVRLMVMDKPGVIADVTAALRDEQVSLEAMIQRARAPGEAVPVVMVMHETGEAGMMRAMARIAKLGTVAEPPRVIRIERL